MVTLWSPTRMTRVTSWNVRIFLRATSASAESSPSGVQLDYVQCDLAPRPDLSHLAGGLRGRTVGLIPRECALIFADVGDQRLIEPDSPGMRDELVYTARCKFWTVGGRERSRLISGSFGLGSGLELLSPVVAP